MSLWEISSHRLRFWSLLAAIAVIGLSFPVLFAKALTVSPPRIELEARAGQQVEKTVRLYNEESFPVRITNETVAVLLREEDGKPSVTDQPAAFGAWLAEIPSVELEAGAWKDVVVSVDVPEAVDSGTSVGAILFRARALSASAAEIGVIGKVGPIVVVTVDNDGIRDGSLELSLQGDKISQNTFDSVPREATVKIHNSGNLGFVPAGSVTIRNWFGGVVEKREINSERRWVLPAWTRTFGERWGAANENGLVREWKQFGFGRYTAEADVILGDKEVSILKPFWVIPWRTSLIALALVAGVGIITRRRRVA